MDKLEYDKYRLNIFRNYLVYLKKDFDKIRWININNGREYTSNNVFMRCTLKYVNEYYGEESFVGRELIYMNSEVGWGMSYYGNIDGARREEVNKVLIEMFKNIGKDHTIVPVRGPFISQKDNYLYNFHSEGTLECFNGEEIIYRGTKLIYKMKCNGGLIR